MERIDFEGKTIDEAISNACLAFQVPREKLQIEILSEAKPGFLGFGVKKAVVRARLLQIDTEIGSAVPVAIEPKASIPPPAFPSNFSIKRSARPKRGEKKGTSTASFTKHKTQRASETSKGKLSTQAINSVKLLEGILTRMGFSAQVKTQETQDAVILKITGDKDGLIIGKKGQNLDAIQYIVNKAVRHCAVDSKKIIIDTEEYRKRREESLVTSAMKAAEKVKKTKKPAILGPFNPRDRRIVHLALRNDKTLTTESRGEGEFRKVVITPFHTGDSQQ
jgi:spoIIIJ-associated protein